MRPLLPQKYHFYIFVFSLILLVIGMPLSKFLMSLSQIILICNWLLEGDLRNKFSSFFKNKAALAVSSLFLLHLIGLLYTSDFNYALNDIKIKMPLLALPLILSTSRHLTLKIKELVMNFFILAVTCGTIISTLIIFDIIHRPLIDIRHASIFISHIRFALLICVAIFICLHFLFHPVKSVFKYFYAAAILWFLIFLILMESITGLAGLAVTAFCYLIYRMLKIERSLIKYSLLSGMFVLISVAGYAVYSLFNEKAEIDDLSGMVLEKYTAQGNEYEHFPSAKDLTENGHYIWIYYSEKELKEEWNKRSKLDFNWRDLKGNVLRHTLVRFLTSKNLRKDAEGLKQLSDEEIQAIERGVSNVNYLGRSNLRGRLYQIKWEIEIYKKTGEASGHSITQRFEAWKAAAGIIKENYLIGVGTGDVQTSFEKQYEKINSRLDKNSRIRSHNQYLSIAVAFGSIGLVWFLFTLFYPVYQLRRFSDFLYLTFFIISLLSFLTEDTLETQAGVTFFAFLNSFFLFSPADEKHDHS
jgi:hypothetical protein